MDWFRSFGEESGTFSSVTVLEWELQRLSENNTKTW